MGNANPLTDDFFVDGDRLLLRMMELCLDEAALAQLAHVSVQTIRNYLQSHLTRPRKAKWDKVVAICQILQIAPSGIQLPMNQPMPDAKLRPYVVETRFLADPQTVRSMEGKWLAESVDIAIPQVVTYISQPACWSGEVTIEQIENSIHVQGIDMDRNPIHARGYLTENGNWVALQYWIDNRRQRLYGLSLLQYFGCGKRMAGLLLGRDAGQSTQGMVVAQLQLTLLESTTLGQPSSI